MESLKKKMRKKMRMRMEMGILYLCSLSSFSLLCFRLKKKIVSFFFSISFLLVLDVGEEKGLKLFCGCVI